MITMLSPMMIRSVETGVHAHSDGVYPTDAARTHADKVEYYAVSKQSEGFGMGNIISSSKSLQ